MHVCVYCWHRYSVGINTPNACHYVEPYLKCTFGDPMFGWIDGMNEFDLDNINRLNFW